MVLLEMEEESPPELSYHGFAHVIGSTTNFYPKVDITDVLTLRRDSNFMRL